MDRCYETGVDLIAQQKLAVPDGQYARTLGSYIDDQTRRELQAFARSEGIDDSSASNVWAINRRISNDLVPGYGIPDGRTGNNMYHDTTLAWKSGFTEQIQKWNAIREGNFLIMRSTQFGGSYVIPRSRIQPYTPIPNTRKGF